MKMRSLISIIRNVACPSEQAIISLEIDILNACWVEG